MGKMRFKAIINDGTAALNFSRAIHGLAKLTKGCAMRITKHALNFVSEFASGGRARYCLQINQKTIFSLFEVTGVEDTHDICLELNAANLSKALKNVTHNTRSITIKLSKKGDYGALFNIVIDQPNDSGPRRSRSVTHDVQIFVISHDKWNELQVPTPLPRPSVNVLFGPFKALASLVSKMRQMDKKVTFVITPNYTSKTAVVDMTTFSQVCRSTTRFRNCDLIPIDGNGERTGDLLTETELDLEQEAEISVSVESNTLHTLLSSFADHSSSMKLGVYTRGFALIYLNHQEVMVMCLLPHFNQN